VVGGFASMRPGFDRRKVSKLADSFAEFMDSLRPFDDAAGASASR
jgi:hypothetical protein